MDYPCAKFGDFSFNLFGFIMRADRQTGRQTDTAKHFAPATVVGVSNIIDIIVKYTYMIIIIIIDICCLQ